MNNMCGVLQCSLQNASTVIFSDNNYSATFIRGLSGHYECPCTRATFSSSMLAWVRGSVRMKH